MKPNCSPLFTCRYPEMAAESDAFLRLLHECVLPLLRTHLLNHWEPRDPEPALAFFEVRVRVLLAG